MSALMHEQLARERMSLVGREVAGGALAQRLRALHRAERRVARASRAAQRARLSLVSR